MPHGRGGRGGGRSRARGGSCWSGTRGRNNFAIQISIKRLSKDKQVRNSMTLPLAHTHTTYLPPCPAGPLPSLPEITLNIYSWPGQADSPSPSSVQAQRLPDFCLCPFYVALVWHISDTSPPPQPVKTLQQYFIWLHTKKKKKKTKTKNKQSTLCHKNTIFIFACKL